MSHLAEESCGDMTTKEIKDELDKMGVSYEGCLERSEIVRVYQEAKQKNSRDRPHGEIALLLPSP